MLSFQIEDPQGGIEFIATEQWATRFRLYFAWDKADRMWSDSSDVGTHVWELHSDDTWKEISWRSMDLTPPDALAPYVLRR